MKKLYEELELEIIRFGAADIITASDAAEDTTTTDDTADDTGDDTTGGLTANPDGSYTDGEHTYTPTGNTVTWSDGNEYPVYHDENGDPYGYVNGEMIYYV